MSKDLTLPDPARFGMTSFAELLASRAPILGEEPGSFETFHEGMMRSLTPFTPYECVVAENLVAIEWELYQQRRMRDASLRRTLREAVHKAVMEIERTEHEESIFAAMDRFIAAGGDEHKWEDPFVFDEEAAEARAADLADRATSSDRDVQAAAEAELVALGLSPPDFMGTAYWETFGPAKRHDAKVQDLERRRREVKRDYDALQKARPVEAEVAQAEVIEG